MSSWWRYGPWSPKISLVDRHPSEVSELGPRPEGSGVFYLAVGQLLFTVIAGTWRGRRLPDDSGCGRIQSDIYGGESIDTWERRSARSMEGMSIDVC